MSENPRAEYFDGIAEQWDGWECQATLAARLDAGLAELGVGADETVVDVGCGTGNLTRALLARLSAAGRVIAVDISPRMIAVARAKVADPRVEWRCADARRLPLPDGGAHRVLCYSVWPHFEDPRAVARELERALRPGGRLHVWHLLPRARINEIHAGAGEAVRHDLLAPGVETAGLLAEQGFAVDAVVDDQARYLISATRRGCSPR
jgi:ubiquinone/menaquinone biosynthesis C-methylase UbiE